MAHLEAPPSVRVRAMAAEMAMAVTVAVILKARPPRAHRRGAVADHDICSAVPHYAGLAQFGRLPRSLQKKLAR